MDWDDLMLGDPLRDIGPLLWWYVEPSKWGEFFDAYGLEQKDGITQRFFWRVAEHSLDIGLSLFERGADDRAREFLEDDVAAVKREENQQFSDPLGG